MVGLEGERRLHWDPELMPDERVLHYWDAKRFAGPWFAKEVQGKARVDVGYLFSIRLRRYLGYRAGAAAQHRQKILDTGPELRNKLALLIKE